MVSFKNITANRSQFILVHSHPKKYWYTLRWRRVVLPSKSFCCCKLSLVISRRNMHPALSCWSWCHCDSCRMIGTVWIVWAHVPICSVGTLLQEAALLSLDEQRSGSWNDRWSRGDAREVDCWCDLTTLDDCCWLELVSAWTEEYGREGRSWSHDAILLMEDVKMRTTNRAVMKDKSPLLLLGAELV